MEFIYELRVYVTKPCVRVLFLPFIEIAADVVCRSNFDVFV